METSCQLPAVPGGTRRDKTFFENAVSRHPEPFTAYSLGVTRHMPAGCERVRRWGAMVRRTACVDSSVPTYRYCGGSRAWPQFLRITTHAADEELMPELSRKGTSVPQLCSAASNVPMHDAISLRGTPQRSGSVWDRLHPACAACSSSLSASCIWSVWCPARALVSHATNRLHRSRPCCIL